jgi:ATP-dependent helicase/nuclease subunit B
LEAWLARCAGESRGAGGDRRRLGPSEEWLLWREAAQQAGTGLELAAPSALAEGLRRSAALARDWGMRWPGDPTQESTALARARRAFEDRCHSLGAWPASDWEWSLSQIAPPVAPLLVAGFDNLGTRLAARLRELGATIVPPPPQDATTAASALVAGVDGADELRRAAHWCRDRLLRNPDTRLLVVDLALERRRPLVLQCFEHELLGLAAGTAGQASADAPFAIEGGQELASHPTVAAALGLLRLACGAPDFHALSALLRSPYVRLGGAGVRAALELRLRERNIVRADCALLERVARRGATDLSPALGSLVALANELAPERAAPARWGPRFAAVLEAGGWPGEAALASTELQQCDRFRKLLGEFAQIEPGGARLDAAQACELLEALARRTAFDAATGDVPVTITASTGDPLVAYDGIWVAGLTSEAWPAPARADPFVPLAAQHAVDYPPASARGRLEQARRAMACWARSAGEFVCSWSGSDGDVPLQPSGLLAGVSDAACVADAAGAAATSRGAAGAPVIDGLVAALRASGAREPRPPDRVPAWPAGVALAGGTRILELQSECPFRAAAELRLGARSLAEPIPGFDHRERGVLLHDALDRAWREIRDSRTLRRLAGEEAALETLARKVAGEALRSRLARREVPVAQSLADNEARRLSVLLAAELRAELARAPEPAWRTQKIEEGQQALLAGRALRIRMDRVDELEDGRLVVIDYKSGAAQSFQPLDERPRQAQLLAYALAAGENVAGIAMVHLTAKGVAWRGATADPALLPKLGRAGAPGAAWPQLLAHWRSVLERLVGDFSAGRADVDPLPDACETCPLPMLCRIDSARVLELSAGNDAAADDDAVPGND